MGTLESQLTTVGGGFMGANAGGQLGFGNPTEENQTHVSARLADEYVSEIRMSAKEPFYPVGDSKQEASIRPHEIAFTNEGMRSTGEFMEADQVMIATSLNGWGEEELKLLRGMPDELIEEAIIDGIRIVGVTYSEVDYEPNRFGLTASKPVALVTSGKVTLPAFFNFAPGDLLEAVPMRIPDRFSGRPNGIPHTKVILAARPYDPDQRDFASVFRKHAELRVTNYDVYSQVFSRMHSQRGLNREAAWKAIEEALLSCVVLGAHWARRGEITDAQMMDALGIETSNEPTNKALRERVLKSVLLPETEIFSTAAVGGDGNDNRYVTAGGMINMNEDLGRLLNAQVNLTRKLSGGMASFHRMFQDRIIGTAVTGGKENGVFDANLKQ